MDRRTAVTAVGLVVAYGTRDFAAPLKPGVLKLDLNQYQAIQVIQGARETFIHPADLFDALKEE